MGKFQVIDHPLIQHKLTIIREKNCGTKVFREVVDEIAMLMAYEVSRDMPLEDIEIETPIGKSIQKTLSGKSSYCTNLKSRYWHGRWYVTINSSC